MSFFSDMKKRESIPPTIRVSTYIHFSKSSTHWTLFFGADMAERLNAIAYAHHMSNPDSAATTLISIRALCPLMYARRRN